MSSHNKTAWQFGAAGRTGSALRDDHWPIRAPNWGGGKAVVVFAADHGVTAEGVSAYPQVDGYIATAGALVAAALQPRVKGHMIASHTAVEMG